MAIVPVNFGIQSNPGRYGQDGSGRLINCYAEARGENGKAPVVIYATPGLTQFATEATATTGTRGLIVVDGSLYWVVDKQLRKVDSTGSHSFIAGIADNGAVQMARNSKSGSPQTAIVTQGGLRFILESDVLTPIADTDLPPPLDVEFQGGYMLYLLANGRVFYSELNDAANVSSGNFLNAEARPDGGKAVIVVGNIIWVFGDKTIQPFQNTGGTKNPFTPLLGGIIEHGCLATATVALLDNSAIFVDNKRLVRRLTGNTPVVGNNDVHELLRNETTPDNLNGDVFSIQGHEFYVLSGTNFTVVYDAATNLWHEKQSDHTPKWRGLHIIKFGDKIIAGDRTNGNLYEIDPDVYSENSNNMIMTIESPIFDNTPERLQCNELWLDYQAGVGLNSSDTHDSAPVVMLQSSYDGVEWGNQRTRPLGPIGRREVRAKFNRLGTDRYKGRIFKASVSANVVRAFIQAHGDFERVGP